MTEEQKSEDLLSLDEAAQVLGISKPTLYRLLSAGDLRGIKVGRQWRFRNGDLKDYLERTPLSMSLPRTSEIEAEIAFFEEAMRSGGHEIPDAVHDSNRTPAEQQALLLVERILQHAIGLTASDIHVEPMRIEDDTVVLVRYRIDGVLHDIRHIPEPACEAVAASIKTAADLNVADRRTPRLTRFPFRFLGKPFRIHVGTIPTMAGEDIVMRIENQSSLLVSMDRLGLTPDQRSTIDRVISRPNGFVIFTGPMGCGKTTTGYACICRLASPEKKLFTIEDPVEERLPYATQVQVDRRSANLSSPMALRFIKAHDPDIIYLADIKDQETAKLAAELALEGHLMLISLHTYDASGVFDRLMNAGIEAHVLATTVMGIVAQRLARLLCPACKKPAPPIDPALLEKVRELAAEGGYDLPADPVFYESVGCDQCRIRGYKGRIGLFEVLEVTDTIATAVVEGMPPEELRKLVRATGTQSIFASGIQKAVEGLTTIEEVMRVTYSSILDGTPWKTAAPE